MQKSGHGGAEQFCIFKNFVNIGGIPREYFIKKKIINLNTLSPYIFSSMKSNSDPPWMARIKVLVLNTGYGILLCYAKMLCKLLNCCSVSKHYTYLAKYYFTDRRQFDRRSIYYFHSLRITLYFNNNNHNFTVEQKIKQTKNISILM